MDCQPPRKVRHRCLGCRVSSTFVNGMKALMEEMLTMAPRPFSTIPFEKTWVTRNVPMKFSSNTRRNPAGSGVEKGLGGWVGGSGNDMKFFRGAATGIVAACAVNQKSGGPHNFEPLRNTSGSGTYPEHHTEAPWKPLQTC